MAVGTVMSGYAGVAYTYQRTVTTVKTSSHPFVDQLANRQQEQDRARSDVKDDGKTETGEEPGSANEKLTAADCMSIIKKRMQEIFVKVQNGDTETSYQIGSQTFTIKEWDEFLEKFDKAEEAIRELMREDQRRQEKTSEESGIKNEKVSFAEDQAGIDALVSEATQCTYPSSDAKEEDTRYITWYTEEGIFCRKAGQSEGYEWSIPFQSREDYDKVMEFLSRFDKNANMRFASHENFWKDFLNDKIDTESFIKFFEGTDNGVPNYTVTEGDSTYVDRDKMQWAKYMNSFGIKFYTREEMMKMQEELIAANAAKLTNLANPYSKTFSGYYGERIFCMYPGGPLYTADEIAEKMMENLYDLKYQTEVKL